MLFIEKGGGAGMLFSYEGQHSAVSLVALRAPWVGMMGEAQTNAGCASQVLKKLRLSLIHI
eukprot:6143437-Amphidinium_carterae.1